MRSVDAGLFKRQLVVLDPPTSVAAMLQDDSMGTAEQSGSGACPAQVGRHWGGLVYRAGGRGVWTFLPPAYPTPLVLQDPG